MKDSLLKAREAIKVAKAKVAVAKARKKSIRKDLSAVLEHIDALRIYLRKCESKHQKCSIHYKNIAMMKLLKAEKCLVACNKIIHEAHIELKRAETELRACNRRARELEWKNFVHIFTFNSSHHCSLQHGNAVSRQETV